MKILFLHGWHSSPGGLKPTYLKDRGHEVCNPALPDDDFDAAVGVAQAAFDRQRPDVVVGSSRGGAVAMNINSGDTPLVLLCPAWKHWGTARTVKPATVIVHSPADEVVPFADSFELLRNSSLPPQSLVEVGADHRLADAASLAEIADVAETAFALAILHKNVAETEKSQRLLAGALRGGVPLRYGIGTLLVLTAMYALLFGILQAFEAPPLIFVTIVSFFTIIGLGQRFLFKGRWRRSAAAITGAAFFAVLFRDEAQFRIEWSLCGASCGYLAGRLIAGGFALVEIIAKIRRKRLASDNHVEQQALGARD